MKSLTFALLFAICAAAAPQAHPLAGLWEFTLETFGEVEVHRVTFEIAGEKLSGTAGGNRVVQGTVRGDALDFEVRFRDGNSLWGKFTGRSEGDRLSGDGTWFELPVRWRLRRFPARSESPRVHNFVPKEFHRVFSATIPPVLRILPGDSVRTWSVDAGGRDQNNQRRSLGGNPLTGPFYIEGALPGDTLVVKLTRVRLNRDSAGSGRNIIGSALLPAYLRSMKPPETFDSSWKLDHARGVARLAKAPDRLKNFEVPLRPMLGCVGVAPQRRAAITSSDSGFHGGNMDYNEIREGTTLYMPVFHAGALLYVGDGHAAQGDGELTGDALETSMDIEFSVDVIQNQSPPSPLAENDDYLIAIGIGGSLNEAMQIATTSLTRWIERDYKLNASEAAIVMGFAVRYDVADLVGSQVSIAAKMPKKLVAQIPK